MIELIPSAERQVCFPAGNCCRFAGWRVFTRQCSRVWLCVQQPTMDRYQLNGNSVYSTLLASSDFAEKEGKEAPDEQKWEQHGYAVLDAKAAKLLQTAEKRLRETKVKRFLIEVRCLSSHRLLLVCAAR